MNIQSALPAPTLHPSSPTPPAPPKQEPGIRDVVAERAEQWGHEAKKLGALGLVAAGSSLAQLYTIEGMVRLNLPLSLGLPMCIGSAIGAMALVSVEEKHLGLGRRLGNLAGGALGAVAGGAEGVVRHFLPHHEAPEKVELPQRAPSGRKAYDALLPRAIHAFTGQGPRPAAVEMGELAGATLGTLAVAYTLPRMAGELVGGPFGAVMQTVVGPLTGMVLGGLEENSLGVGRGLGELVGRGIAALEKPKPDAPTAPPQAPKEEKPGLLKRAFLEFNHVIGEPLIPYLVDLTMATNPIFQEKPFQSIQFQDRPSPQVDRERLIGNFTKLAGIPGPSGQEKPVGDELCRQLDELGATWKRQADGSVIGTIPATPGQEDSPTVMLSAHQDTVEATSPESFVRGKRWLHTDESRVLGADDRAGCAEILEGVRVVKEQNLPHPELKLVFPVDEERGLVGAGRLTCEEISTRPTLGFVVDSLSVRDVHLANDAVIVAPKSVKYNFSPEDPLIQVVYRSMANAGLKPRPIHAPILTGAGSDANTPGFNSKNIHSLAVGAGERDMHTPLEHVKIDDLEQAARHVVGYITNSCDLKVDGDKIVPRYPLESKA